MACKSTLCKSYPSAATFDRDRCSSHNLQDGCDKTPLSQSGQPGGPFCDQGVSRATTATACLPSLRSKREFLRNCRTRLSDFRKLTVAGSVYNMLYMLTSSLRNCNPLTIDISLSIRQEAVTTPHPFGSLHAIVGRISNIGA